MTGSFHRRLVEKGYETEPHEATMPLTVRSATLADIPVIVEYNRRLAEETESKALDIAILTQGVTAAMADPDTKGPYYVVEENGRVLGQMQITFEFSDWRNGWFWWIQGVYVQAEARGRGIFRVLYEHVCDLARRDGQVIGLRLYVENENLPAQRTYERLGMARSSYQMYEKFPL